MRACVESPSTSVRASRQPRARARYSCRAPSRTSSPAPASASKSAASVNWTAYRAPGASSAPGSDRGPRSKGEGGNYRNNSLIRARTKPRRIPPLPRDFAPRGWSLYGAPWLQPVAADRKSHDPKTSENKPKLLPWVATSCRVDSIVRRGATVRVRQRALQKPRKSGFLSRQDLHDLL